MKKSTIMLLVALGAGFAVAQSYEEWVRQQNQDMKNYSQAQNQAFSKYAEQQWKEYKTFKEEVLSGKPKPKIVPKAKEVPLGTPQSSAQVSSSSVRILASSSSVIAKTPLSSQSSSAGSIVPLSLQTRSSSSVARTPQSSAKQSSSSVVKLTSSSSQKQSSSSVLKTVPSSSQKVSSGVALSSSSDVILTGPVVSVFGVQFPDPIVSEQKAILLKSVNEASVKAWMGASGALSPEVYSIFKKEQAKLGRDWVAMQYAWLSSIQAFPGDTANATLLMWSLLQQSGFDVRLGLDEHKIYLLYRTEQAVYSLPGITIEGGKYYPFVADGKSKFKMGTFRTWPSAPVQSAKPVDLNLTASPLMGKITYRQIDFEYFDDQYHLKIPRNEAMEKLLDTYPLVELPVPGKHRFNQQHVQALADALRPIVSKKNKTDALNIVLRMIQKGFPYKIDEEQFGYERYFFAEEILNFPYSDCEDRSVFFAELVRELFGWRVALLDYPAHIATAVLMPEPPEWAAKIDHEGQKWVICDPTYINANIGTEMPEMMMENRKVIPLD